MMAQLSREVIQVMRSNALLWRAVPPKAEIRLGEPDHQETQLGELGHHEGVLGADEAVAHVGGVGLHGVAGVDDEFGVCGDHRVVERAVVG